MTDPNPKRSTIPAAGTGTLSLYRLKPIAQENDPRWDMASYQGEVVVRAYSPGDARVVAAEAETDYLDVAAAPGHGTSTKMASAFRDDKLYTVLDEPPGDFPSEGERTVVSGLITRDVITPVGRDERS
ncbi:MAG: hypothetical protein ACTHJ3_19285 [Pararhizobium sp.]